jgi:4-hydroxy 2-oxovalerate aldolase
VRKYTKAVEGTGKEIGMHAHNNLQLAFANTVEAIILGANRVDATMLGLGRGAGNCPMEILLGFLRNPKFKLRPVIEVIQNTILPMKADFDWGPSIPYNITGQRNLHPKSAMDWREGDTPDDYLSFFDKIQTDS